MKFVGLRNLICPHIYYESEGSQDFWQDSLVFYFPTSFMYTGHLNIVRDYCHLLLHTACSVQACFQKIHCTLGTQASKVELITSEGSPEGFTVIVI